MATCAPTTLARASSGTRNTNGGAICPATSSDGSQRRSPNTATRQAADIIRLLLLTGARRGEVLQARWADIDLAAGVWSKPGATTKQKTDHQVPLSDAARQLLLDLRQRAPAAAEWVFPAPDGSPRRDVKDAWASLCRAANIKGARVHDLRHTYASVLASAGLSLPIIGALLGHTQPSTTARYAHLFDDPLRAATERAAQLSPVNRLPKWYRSRDGHEQLGYSRLA